MPEHPTNSEADFTEWATSQGWRSLRRGWPDYLCVKPDGSVIVVEVKGRATENLSPFQEEMMEILAALGMPTYKWTPNSGLQRYAASLTPLPHYSVAPRGPTLRRFLTERVMSEYYRFKARVNQPTRPRVKGLGAPP